MKNRGFTLIELLIVIAVLGVLAAGVIVAINPLAKINSANLAKAKTFAASIENNLSVNQVGKWSFEENVSPSKDTSGNGNDGVWNGTIAQKTAAACGLGFGACLGLSGSGGLTVNDSNSLDLTSAMTISLWIRLPSIPTDSRMILYKSSYFLRTNPTGEIPRISAFINGAEPRISLPTADEEVNNWMYLTIVYDSSLSSNNFKLYKNGIIKHQVTFGGGSGVNITTNTNNLFIGELDNIGSNAITADIDEVQIYNQALGLAQIQQLYAQGLHRHIIAKK